MVRRFVTGPWPLPLLAVCGLLVLTAARGTPPPEFFSQPIPLVGPDSCDQLNPRIRIWLKQRSARVPATLYPSRVPAVASGEFKHSGRRDLVVGAVWADGSAALFFPGGDTAAVEKLTAWSYGNLAHPTSLDGMPGLAVASPKDVRKFRRLREGRDPGPQRLKALFWSMADKDVVLEYWEAGEWHLLDLGDD